MAETVTITEVAEKQGIQKITFVFEAHTDGTATGETAGTYTGQVRYVINLPTFGGTAPTAAWDFQIQSEDNYDVLGLAGTDRSTSATQYLQSPTSALGVVFDSKLTLEVSGAGSGGDGTIILYIVS